jgi:hypothetical protein
VNFRCGVTCCGVFLSLLVAGAVSGRAAGKEIRLRNEHISTQLHGQNLAAAQGAEDRPVSGLYLVQFKTRFDPSWREELLLRKVELLRYVPDDAFVVRLRGTRIGELQALSFVHWIGPYRPEHKLHDSLRPGRGREIDNHPAVSVLMSPSASSDEVADVRARFGFRAVDRTCTKDAFVRRIFLAGRRGCRHKPIDL